GGHGRLALALRRAPAPQLKRGVGPTMTRTQADRHLRRFLEGSATAEELAQILATPLDHSAGVTFEPPTSPPLHVASAHLVRVCDAILAGSCEPRLLRDVGFLLIGSDAFEYDGDAQDGARVAE